ncbi:plasma membrane localization protein [Friedmanniomyces endolithicus]|nr:plasma membrane localization protein [Friedmanniomyces endolithicus]
MDERASTTGDHSNVAGAAKMPPKTHLPAHMDSVRQKLRPKHQLLILKCYPRLPKNSAADVKPNGSELSYLLYYASTRRSKLQKVGSFLEHKTERDVYKAQSARVLVTLQILTALLENKVIGEGSPFALIAPYVMRIIGGILQNTNDISLLEATDVTWNAFCKHQDQAVLAADHEYRQLYEKVVGQYAEFAHKAGAKKIGKNTTPVPVHDGIRLREIGLHATKSVISSDALAFESGRHLLTIVVPAILSNLRGDNAAYLENLVLLSKQSEDEEKDKVLNRRQSLATIRTHTGGDRISAEVDPRAAEGTAQDADKLAEEGVALLALDCLKAAFMSENRAQIRAAIVSVLKYLGDLQNYRRPQTSEKASLDLPVDIWAVKIFELCTTWTPVQDRFILLVTTVETLVHLPLKERDLRQHLLYATSVDSVLRSDLNLIGLSVMDVLLGLVQQTLRVLQDSEHSVPTSVSGDDPRLNTSAASTLVSAIPSQARMRLVYSLKACIADLAIHVYYTDQISDMISAIMMRLKPSPMPIGQQNPVATAAAIEEPRSAVNEVASNASFPTRERSSSTSGFFSFSAARQIALELVRDIVKVANSSRVQTSNGLADSRNPIHITIWEGTQWLLRDPDADVRLAYADALITWLELETKKSDFRVDAPKQTPKKRAQASAAGATANGATLARRAVSNASATKDRVQRVATERTSSQQTFLQLLHLAIYENALQLASTSLRDIVILSTLLATLIKRLGVNAVASGLPMIFAMQEEIARVVSPVAKIRLGTLVHSYLWALAAVFDCERDVVGKAILQEVARRKGHGIWVQEVQYPPMPLETIAMTMASRQSESVLAADFVNHEELKAFDERQGLVDAVLEHYEIAVPTPAPYAPGSPGRSSALPTTMNRTSSHLSAKPVPDPAVLGRTRDAMMKKWTREDCLAAIAAMAPKSVSLSGSRSSPTQVLAAATAAAAGGNHRTLLAAANMGPRNEHGFGTPPRPVEQGTQQQDFGAVNKYNRRLHSQSPNRRPSGGSSAGKASTSAAARGPARVEELKRLLANDAFATMPGGTAHRRHEYADPAGDDTASESMVTADEDMGSEDGYGTSQVGKGRTQVKDLSVLLEGIAVDEGGARKVSGMGRPPY